MREAGLVERIHAVAAVEAQRTQHVVDHILVEALARHALEDRAGQVEVQVAVFVFPAAGRIVVVAVAGRGVDVGIDDVDGGPVALAVVDAGGVREQHFEGDGDIRIFGVAYLEAEQVAHIVGQGQFALLHLLQEAGGRKRLGDGGDAPERLVVDRLPGVEVLHAEIVVVDQLVVPDHGASDADSLDFSKICFHIFFKFLFRVLAARKQQRGDQADGKQAFFHFYRRFTDLSGVSSGFFRDRFRNLSYKDSILRRFFRYFCSR